MKNFKKDFTRVADIVIVDSAAGLGNEAMGAVSMADEIIIVTNPEMPAITDALKTAKLAEEMGKPILGVIITKVRKDEIELQPETVREMLDAPILGMVPYDLHVSHSLNLRNAVVHTHPKSPSARAYKEIAARIINVPYDSKKDAESFLEKIFKTLRLKNRYAN